MDCLTNGLIRNVLMPGVHGGFAGDGLPVLLKEPRRVFEIDPVPALTFGCHCDGWTCDLGGQEDRDFRPRRHSSGTALPLGCNSSTTTPCARLLMSCKGAY